ncbi:MAG TPA: hypothetical protein VIP57_04465 [Candidatus Dormibacteraeota bacterium]
MASEGSGSIPNEDEPGSCCLDLALDAAQLRRLLFAKQSAIVAEPDQHQRSLLVERAQRDLVAFEIKDDGLAECLTGGVSHHWRRENPSPTSSVGLSAGRRALLISA